MCYDYTASGIFVEHEHAVDVSANEEHSIPSSSEYHSIPSSLTSSLSGRQN